MDLLDRVRGIGEGADLTTEQYGAARDALEAATTTARPPRRRAWWIGAGAAGGLALAAAATATALVLSQQSAPAPPVAETPRPSDTHVASPTPLPTPQPSASPPPASAAITLLEQAALAAASTSDPALEPGQYLHVHVDLEYLETSPLNASRAEAEAAWWVRGAYDVYIPSDRAGEWIRVFPDSTEIVDTFGDGADALAQAWLAQAGVRETIVERVTGGLVPPYEEGGTVYASDAYWAQMPRDPRALIDWYEEYLGKDLLADPRGEVVRLLIQDLETNAAPAGLRATMFRALGLIEGVEVETTEDSRVTLAYEFTTGAIRRTTLTIDTATGMFVASTSGAGETNAIIPDALPDRRNTVTVSVVDEAP
jgi:hypothetical protein